ncbi:hypothetical protein [Paenibacillus sp. FSL H3-0310]|uniref:hypothetical protein n=1 Tax=Paenibacillus sp. FSL H3-0310 TaxID=2921429 RepID=UPI0030FB9911
MELRDGLELVYFITGGPVLALIGVYGLKQLKISKKDISTRIEREGLIVASDQVKIFLENIIPIFDDFTKKLNESMNAGVCERFDISDFKWDTFKQEYSTEKAKEYNGLMFELIEELLLVLNALESFSVYFTKRVGNEEIAYSTMGLSYCDTISVLYPFLCRLTENGHFSNIVELTLLWNDRRTIENTEKEIDRLKKNLETKNKKKLKLWGV